MKEGLTKGLLKPGFEWTNVILFRHILDFNIEKEISQKTPAFFFWLISVALVIM